jgi:drug/metabolite transporter (DMT)-like permease
VTDAQQTSHRIGLLLVATAALCWSSSGLFVRTITADLFTMLFWRGIFSGGAVFALFVLIERKSALKVLRSLGWPVIAVAALSASGMITGIGSLRFATAADAMVIYATVPFVTAGLAYLALGERPTRSTLVASAVAILGVGVMLWGAEFGGSMLGRGLSVLSTLSMAGMTVLMRTHREVPMLPAMALSGWICSAVCLGWAAPLSISASMIGLCAVFGVVQNASGLALYTFGSKRVPAAEATLLASLEVPFTPLWVFLLLGERPADQTLLGGAIVLVALFVHIASEFRDKTPEEPGPFSVAP